MSKCIVTGLVCLVVGYVAGTLACEKKHPTFLAYTIADELSSEGKQAVLEMRANLLKDLRPDLADLFSDKTRALQEITAEMPNRSLANFYMGKLEQTTQKIQGKVDQALLNTLEKMPLSDRRLYLKYYLKNKDFLKYKLIIDPMFAHKINDDNQAEQGDPRPRDQVVRKPQI